MDLNQRKWRCRELSKLIEFFLCFFLGYNSFASIYFWNTLWITFGFPYGSVMFNVDMNPGEVQNSPVLLPFTFDREKASVLRRKKKRENVRSHFDKTQAHLIVFWAASVLHSREKKSTRIARPRNRRRISRVLRTNGRAAHFGSARRGQTQPHRDSLHPEHRAVVTYTWPRQPIRRADLHTGRPIAVSPFPRRRDSPGNGA